ncbi:hypothetical protein C8J57DRAFT_1355673 [Mycena rebaudengoi]|nr:hypothetical protein C8J57DRAFT_1355673 [Mycena rebaudengoi]
MLAITQYTYAPLLLMLVCVDPLLRASAGIIPSSTHLSSTGKEPTVRSTPYLDARSDSVSQSPDCSSDSDSDDPNDLSYEYSEGENGDDSIISIDVGGVTENLPPLLRNWINEDVPAPPNNPDACNVTPENCDNGGSGNCVLCEKEWNFDDAQVQKRFDSPPRVITGNATYRFLPGETMIVRQSSKRAPQKTLVFNCDPKSPGSLVDVCENMCFGLNCLGIANKFQRETNKGNCRKNRTKNACAKKLPNRCSNKYTGRDRITSPSGASLSCDEFPFASTQQATKGGLTATRCVTASHNSKQGGKIAAFYRYTLGPTDDFEVKFDYGNGPEDATKGPNSYTYCRPKLQRGKGVCLVINDPNHMQMS